MTANDIPPLGRGALRTYRFILNQGGWWNLREIVHELLLSDHAGVHKQLQMLHAQGHIARKGAGVAGDPYRFGVIAACTPVPSYVLECPP
jgi:predicted DNA-binding transcriptional regulator